MLKKPESASGLPINSENQPRDQAPSAIGLPQGGGAIRGLGEKFSVNTVTGTASLSLPIPCAPGRSGFGPQLALSYDSGSGNGPFGFGWNLSLSSITRRTDRGLPRYQDEEESDVFILSGSEDLVPALVEQGGAWTADETVHTLADSSSWLVRRYRPRIEGLFARIERWTNSQTGDIHWRTLTRTNQTTFYGRTPGSRIADPADPTHIYAWLICESHDDKGNVITYEYKAEDSAGVDTAMPPEAHRTPSQRSANRYLKRIRYGNRTPHRAGDDASLRGDWMFELVFDYGEHDPAAPTPREDQAWPVRLDAFSGCRAGFEVRTYRLCRRVLQFHHFPEEAVGHDCLVRSIEFDYTQGRNASFLSSVAPSGYLRSPGGPYTRKSLPPIELVYSQPALDETLRRLDPISLENLPAGLEESRHHWVDLDGEGLPGILTEQGGSWHYKPNLGNGVFGPLGTLSTRPVLAEGTRPYFTDLAGDGCVDVVQFQKPLAGFYERAEPDGWASFRPFRSVPDLDWNDSNIRFVDLTGDGRADILITEDDRITWYPSLGEEGFGPARCVYAELDEQRRPRLVAANRDEAVYLADMNGDGLADLVRIRNGSVNYWPNLGYGRFGARVSMANAPHFASLEEFDQRRIRMADLDGSGIASLVYLGRDGAHLYFNESGNGWSSRCTLSQFPVLDDTSNVAVLDLLGNGTACLVWSSPLPREASAPLRYIDLMGGVKPHLLVTVKNNMGAETRVSYTPSTRYFLEDKAAGRPWATRLPFPVHCVSRVEHLDHLSGQRYTSNYAYHHGYYDAHEREFRGFGRIDQLDSESFPQLASSGAANAVEARLHQPPILTRTWFHTGAAFDQKQRLYALAHEYYQNLSLAKHLLPDVSLPVGLGLDEEREALRACKGMMLRQEVYSPDGTPSAEHPYVVTQSSSRIHRVQPRHGDHPASFLVTRAQSLSYHYERNPADPRIEHSLVLETDALGNTIRSASVVYPRRGSQPDLPPEVIAAQSRRYITYNEVDYTQDVEVPGPRPTYRLRQPFESRSFELTGVAPSQDGFFCLEELRTAAEAAPTLPFEIEPSPGPAKRLLARTRTLFLRDDLSGPLPAGQLGALGLIHETYQLALTPSLVAQLYGTLVPDSLLQSAGYVHLEGVPEWWAPSGTVVYPPEPANRFYLPVGGRDPFGNRSSIRYDAYALLVTRSEDAVGNVVTTLNDYRLLAPVQLTDPNLNRTAMGFDELGMLTHMALLGKEGAAEGDTLDAPTVRMEYQLFNWRDHGKPNAVRTLQREQHGPTNTRWRESYTYSDGRGATLLSKVQAEPGLAMRWNPATGKVEEVDTTPAVRWVGTGRTLLNNKGNVVRQYQPYFSVTHEYEQESELRETGVSSLMLYDPLGRAIRTERPDGTFTQVAFSPWERSSSDANDTVKESRWYQERGSPDPSLEPEPVEPERRAAWLTAKHAQTPFRVHFDVLGRAIYAVADNGSRGKLVNRAELDLTGNSFKLFDARNRCVASTQASMLGTAALAETAEKGERRILLDVLGRPTRMWDSRQRTLRMDYDAVHRPLSVRLCEGDAPEKIVAHHAYGESHPNATALNLRGRLHRSVDQAGLVTLERCDFKSNPLRVSRRLALDYAGLVDWSALVTQADPTSWEAAAGVLLESETFTASSAFDALNRPTELVLPEGTVIQPTYNAGAYLASLHARVRGRGSFQPFLVEQHHDARGQRLSSTLANGTTSTYAYHPQTLRLVRAATRRVSDGTLLQDLGFVFDPEGNITQYIDNAQQTLFFQNTVVRAESLYEYDAVYQLIKATGREHASPLNDTPRDQTDAPWALLPAPSDAQALRSYTEQYTYDELGNLLSMRHLTQNGGWNRQYRYGYQADAADRTNRLIATSLPGDPAGTFSASYRYDPSGNMSQMPHLASLQWNFLDQLKDVDMGGGGKAHYVYSAGGQRIRKVIVRNGGQRVERIYLGAVEIYRESLNGSRLLERQTVHILDGSGTIAQIDTKTVDVQDPRGLDTPIIRYQYGNHIGSAVLELDAAGSQVSYEEYHPFGTTAYRAGRSGAEVSLKRYRYVGRERDDETGLHHHGARYYAAWLGRWTSADPGGFVDGINLYKYARNNPVTFVDANGFDSQYRFPLPKDLEKQVRNPNPASGKAIEKYLEGRTWTLNGQESQLSGEMVWREDLGAWYYAFTVTPVGGAGEAPSGAGGGQGSAGASAPPGPNSDSGAGSDTTTATNPVEPIREGVRAAATPRASTGPMANLQRPNIASKFPEAGRNFGPGEFLEGPYNLWSKHPEGLESAVRSPGFIMEDTVFEQTADDIARNLGHADRYAVPYGTPDFDAVWHPTSDALAVRAGISQTPVSSHGLDIHPAPQKTVQVTREIPRITVAGGVMAQVSKFSGAMTILGSLQADNPWIKGAGVTAGVTEFMAGNVYLYGLVTVGSSASSATLMAAGRMVGGAAGGVGMALLSGYQAYQEFQRGDYVAGGFDTAAAVGGVLIAIGAIASAPALAIVGAALGIIALGFHVGRWLDWW